MEHLNLRTIESHEYTNGGQLQRNKHYDAGSIVTIDIMLNDSNNEFQGGELSFPQFIDQELDEPNTSRTNNVDIIKLEKGDMALFLSHKYHNVLPIRSGKRHVLVMELWNGPEKTCPHRCETVGKCTHTLNRSHLEIFATCWFVRVRELFLYCTCKYLKYIHISDSSYDVSYHILLF